MSYVDHAQSSYENVSKHVPESLRVYLPILPVMTLVGVFILYPIAQAIYSSFFAKSLLQPDQAEFVGLANYVEIWTDPDIHQVLWNTAIWVSVGSLAAIVLGFLMGWLLDEKLPYTSVASAIVLIPWVLPASSARRSGSSCSAALRASSTNCSCNWGSSTSTSSCWARRNCRCGRPSSG
ncbi:carbohydrate ABC transporter permease [Halomicroarcula sp. GCM10025709]|uniref:carbohydrate ABC transporter permease n=1 Tax=Halomicroarcula sp. GCM10025709 TaxID=3252669 RepID=UPI00361F77D5